MRPRLLRLLTVALTLAALGAMPASANALSPSDPDPTYGSGGFSSVGVPTENFVSAIVAQPDGKAVMGLNGQSNSPRVARLMTDGSLDPSFGAGGIATLDTMGAVSSFVKRVLVAPSGKIYVAGSLFVGVNSLTLWALTPDGKPDESFAPGGIKILPLFGSMFNEFADAALTPDGNIAISATVQTATTYQLGFRVYSPSDGALLSHQHDFTPDDVTTSALAVRPDGSLLIAVNRYGANDDTSIVHFNGATLDSGFGTAGFAKFGSLPNESAFVRRILVSASGLVGVGLADYTAAFASFSPAGANTTFSDVGVVRTLPAGLNSAISTDASTAAGGRVVAVGYGQGGGAQPPYVIRYEADGHPDGSFAPDGVGRIAKPASEASIAVQPDGKYLIAARGADGQVFVTRLWGDHALPTPATASFARTLKKKMKASKSRKISGTAGGTDVGKVEIAIQRVDAKLLKKSKKCTYVKSARGTTKNYKAAPGKCRPAVWLAAKGTTSWSLKLRRSLPPGKYVFNARATGLLGVGAITMKNVKLVK